jgi:uncharacterized protein (DUF2252 family)
MTKRAKMSPRPPERQALLGERQRLKMARSIQAYVRGNTGRFYEWLASAGRSRPQGPPIWICGDCHLGNLGPVADADGKVRIEMRDFDQSVIGNPADDLIRLGLSLAVAARGSELPGVTTAKMMEQMIEGYRRALAPGADRRDHEGKWPEVVRVVMRQAVDRSWKALAKERLDGVEPEIPLGKRFWRLSQRERRAIGELFASEPMRRLATSLGSRRDGAEIELLDAAYWVKGCSSLGRLRYAALVGVGGQHRDERGLCLMDIKEAIQPLAPRAAHAGMPRDHAARVVEGARRLAPALGERMIATELLGRAVFVRELLPQDLKVDIERLTREEAMRAAHRLAWVVGRSHARQLDAGERRRWSKEMSRHHSKRLDAPSWLWSSVVDLVSSHEAGYLDHCRRYALAGTAR